MVFSEKQVQLLRRDIHNRNIRTRESNGRELCFIEGWYAISEANRIFGFDSWNRETVESKCVIARENRGTYLAVYTARVRITVNADGSLVIREGHGTGEGRGSSPGEVHDIALKAAETDATKRALATFGKPFGLALYRHGRIARPLQPKQASLSVADPGRAVALPPDDTTPIPRPSKFYGRPQDPVTRERSLANQVVKSTADTSLVPNNSGASSRIDKSVLTIGEPKRLRDKNHLRFVASHPCLVCGRQPSDPHHLQFAQPRALGLKVSDEFTVPLCRTHHRQLHNAGNELVWWKGTNIDANPVDVAKSLWQQTRLNAPPSLSLQTSKGGD